MFKFCDNVINMEKKLKYLEEKYGGPKPLAKVLGISWRHYYRISREGYKINKTLEKLINIIAET